MTRNIVEATLEEPVDDIGTAVEDSAQADHDFAQGDDSTRLEAESRRDLAHAKIEGLEVTPEEATRDLEGEMNRLENLDPHDQCAAGYNPEAVSDMIHTLTEAAYTLDAVEAVNHQEDQDYW